MRSPFRGLEALSGAALLQPQLEHMVERCDAVFQALLGRRSVAVAQTPSHVVHTEGRLRLLRYTPAEQQVFAPPLLIVPSLVNRYYILDLLPGKSLVEHLVGRGLDVYLLDWGVPTPADRAVSFDYYVTGYLRHAVQRVRALAGREQVSLLGYSLGGTLTTIFTALFPHYVRNLAQIAALVNFHDDGVISQWTRKERFNVDLVVDTLGTMPVELMAASFRMLKPTVQIAQRVTVAHKLRDTEAVRDFLALQTWLNDLVPFPAEAYRAFMKECYQENHLVQGKLVIDGRRVDLSRISCPLLTIVGARDHICPPASVVILNELVSSDDKTVLELPGGHVQLVSGRRASTKVWPPLAEWLIARSTVG